jgi:pilus assembly protein CpaB
MVRVLILSVAVLSGGVAAWLSMDSQRSNKSVDIGERLAYEDILVASVSFEPGEELHEDKLEWKRWPTEATTPDIITKTENADTADAFQGKVARSKIAAGEPIRKDKILDRGAGILSMSLRPGKRAIAVKISAGNTASGFILPNDRVDVVHTGFTQRGQTGSRTILSNIRVLAIDQSSEGLERPTSGSGKTATLELNPSQVEILTAAEANGIISLALRAYTDTSDAMPADEGSEQSMTNTIRIIESGKTRFVTVDFGIGK